MSLRADVAQLKAELRPTRQSAPTTPEDAAALEEARSRLLAFTRRTFPGFQVSPHHELLAEYLEAVEAGAIRRLIVELPPRHGKSELVSIRFPAWLLGRRPERQVIVASYAADLALTFSRQARNLLDAPQWPFPDVRLAPDASATRHWLTDRNGGYLAAGVGGPITGHGAHAFVIDDPVKNAEEAASEIMRERVWSWYISTARTRLQPDAVIVLCLTRWHEDDLAGRLIERQEQGGEYWEVLKLPALAEEGDPLGRAIGDPLWPEWFGRAALDATRQTVGSRVWSALYQQHPTPDAGGTFKRQWFTRRYRTLPRLKKTIQAVDSAFKTGVANDYSVIATWGTDGVDFYLIDLWRDRVEFPELKRAIRDQHAKHRPSAVLLEDAASGQSAIQELRRETSLPIVPVKAVGSKESRAEAVSPLAEAGKVLLPEYAAWVDAWIEEQVTFPTGRFDDQVDTTSMALLRLTESTRSRTGYTLTPGADGYS